MKCFCCSKDYNSEELGTCLTSHVELDELGLDEKMLALTISSIVRNVLMSRQSVNSLPIKFH